MTDTEATKQTLREPRLERRALTNGDFLKSGSTLLDLGLTGNLNGGFVKGTYSLFVGDTDSGKTFITMNCLAEAAINPAFDNYRFLFFNKERGALMDIEQFFGSVVEERLEWIYIDNTEEMYFVLDDAIADGRPFICIVDSIDALSTEYEGKKFQQRKKAAEKGKEAAGSYGGGQANIHSENIRRILSGLERTGSICIFINQTRDNIGAGPFEKKSRHSGGRAISFYACQKLWSSHKSDIKKQVKGKNRVIGTNAKVLIARSRITGKGATVEVPILNSYGIDDLAGCIDYLVSESDVSGWKQSGSTIDATKDLEFKGQKEKLIEHIQDNDLEFDLRSLVYDTWKEIEEKSKPKRKPRYK